MLDIIQHTISSSWIKLHLVRWNNQSINQSMRTDLVSSDLSVWSGVGSDVTVEEVTDGRWCVHHVHSLHVQLEQVLGCTADQFWDNNGLKQKALSLLTSILYLPDKNQMSIKYCFQNILYVLKLKNLERKGFSQIIFSSREVKRYLHKHTTQRSTWRSSQPLCQGNGCWSPWNIRGFVKVSFTAVWQYIYP